MFLTPDKSVVDQIDHRQLLSGASLAVVFLPIAGALHLGFGLLASFSLIVFFGVAFFQRYARNMALTWVIFFIGISIPIVNILFMILSIYLMVLKWSTISRMGSAIAVGLLAYVSPAVGSLHPGAAAIASLAMLVSLWVVMSQLSGEGVHPVQTVFFVGAAPVILLLCCLPFIDLDLDLDSGFSLQSLLPGDTTMDVSDAATPVASTDSHFVEPHYVEGYFRDDNTYVEAHWRDGDGDTNVNRTIDEGGGYIRSNPSHSTTGGNTSA